MVNGAYESKDDKGNTTTKHALNAGGFAGSPQAAILDKDSAKGTGWVKWIPNNDPAALTVTGCAPLKAGNTRRLLRPLLMCPASPPSAGGEARARTPTCCSNCSRSATGVLEAFRTFIYDGQVNGVNDGIQIVAHDSTTKGMLDSKRYTGAAGGFWRVD